MADLAAAQEARDDFLAEQEFKYTKADGTTEVDVKKGKAVAKDVTDYASDMEAIIKVDIAAFDASKPATAQGLISDHRSDLEKTITNKNKDVAAAEKAVKAGVLDAISNVEGLAETYKATIESYNADAKVLTGKAAEFGALNGNAAVAVDTTADPAEVTLGVTKVATLVNGEWKAETGATATGLATYLEALQSATDSQATMNSAKASLKAAIAEVIALENEDDDITADDISDDVINDGGQTVNAKGEASVSIDFTKDTMNVAATARTDTVTFTDIIKGQKVTVADVVLTATAAMTAKDVAEWFADADNWTNTDWTVGEVSGADNQLTFTYKADGASAAIVAKVEGTPGKHVVTFIDMTEDDTTITVGTTSHVFSSSDKAKDVAEWFAANFTEAGWEVSGDGADGTLTFTSTEVVNPVAALALESEHTSKDVSGVKPTGAVTNGDTAATASNDVSKAEEDGTAATTDNSGETAPLADAVLAERVLAEAAEKALEDFNEKVENWEGAVALKGEYDALDNAASDAEKAITNATDADPAGLGIKLLQGAESFTNKDDVYLFNADASKGKTLANFGKDGDDKIFFGDSFAGGLKEITKVADDNGDASALEIFWLQVGTKVELYVEQKTFAGNGSTDSDMVKVTLTGVDGADLSLENGFLTIG